MVALINAFLTNRWRKYSSFFISDEVDYDDGALRVDRGVLLAPAGAVADDDEEVQGSPLMTDQCDGEIQMNSGQGGERIALVGGFNGHEYLSSIEVYDTVKGASVGHIGNMLDIGGWASDTKAFHSAGMTYKTLYGRQRVPLSTHGTKPFQIRICLLF